MKFSKEDIIQLIRFNIMGVLHVVTFSLVLWVGNELGLSYFLAGALGYIAVLLEGAIGNIYYVFSSLSEKDLFWKYFIGNSLVYIISVMFELAITHKYIPYLEAHNASSVLIVSIQYAVYILGGIFVYLMTKYVVFRKK